MNKFERMIKNLCGPSPFISDAVSELQRDLEAEHYRRDRSQPWRYEPAGTYAPRTMQEAGL